MAELVDALDSKSSVSNNVWVRVPPQAPLKNSFELFELWYIENLSKSLFYVIMNMTRRLAYNKKEEHLISQVNVASKLFELTLYQCWKSVYFFIASTNKVESNKMIAMSFKTFKIKVLVFINIYLLSFTRLEDDTHIKYSY